MLEELKKFGSSQLGFEMEFGQVDIGKAKTNKSERFKRRQKNFVTLSSINDVTPNSEKDVSLNSENDVKPSSMNNVTPNLLKSVTLTSINDATLNSEKDVTLTPENDATVSLNSDQETAHSTPTEETTKSLSTNLSAIFSDVSFVKKSKKRGFEIKDENLNGKSLRRVNQNTSENEDVYLNDLNDSLSEEPFRMRKKYLHLSKMDSESLSLSQSQSSWEESADLNLLGDFTIEKRPNVFNSTNGIDQSVLGLDLTEEDSMMQSTNQSPTNQSPTNQSLTDSHSFANSRLVSHLEENLETVSSPATKKRFRIHRVRRSLPLNESSLAKDSLKRATNHVNRILSGPNDEVANVDQNQGTKISNANLSLSGEKDEVANVDQTRGTKIPKGSSPNAFQLISNDMNENGTVGITTASQEKAKGEEVFFRKNRKRGYPSEQSSQATKKAKEAEHPEENQLKNDSGESGKNVKESDLEDDRIIKASGSGQQPDSGSPFTVRS